MNSELSIERKFRIAEFNSKVDRMNLEQSQMFLKDLFTKFMVQETIYADLIKHQWGLDNNAYEQIKHDYNLPEVD